MLPPRPSRKGTRLGTQEPSTAVSAALLMLCNDEHCSDPEQAGQCICKLASALRLTPYFSPFPPSLHSGHKFLHPEPTSQLTPEPRGWDVLLSPAQKLSKDYPEVTFAARGIFLRTFPTPESPPCFASAAPSQEPIDFLLLKYINVIKVSITQPGICDLQS